MSFLPTFPPAIPAQSRFLDSDGVSIHYTMEGVGEPVLLIHGFGTSLAGNWAQPGIIRGLTETHQVIAIDNRGHGASDKPYDSASYERGMIDDVIRLMDHLHIDKAHIVGYSLGGLLTQTLLVEHPDRMLTATIGGIGWRDPHDGVLDKLLETIATSLEAGTGITPLILATVPGSFRPSPEKLELLNELFHSVNDPIALAAAARGIKKLPPAVEASMRANHVPVLALIGELDPAIVDVERLATIMPSLQKVVIPGGNHTTAFANPIFLSSLKAFLAAHAQR